MSNVIMAGTWSFPKRVTEDDLIKVAQEIADGADGEKFTDLHVRGASKETWGIGFKYRLSEADTETEHTAVFHKFRGLFCKRFNLTQERGDKLCWDISSPITVIK